MGKNTAERDRMEMEGVVVESANGKFKVQVNEDYFVLCTLSGKIRMNDIKVIIQDKVKIEVSPYDTSQGRIILRIK